MKNMDCFTHRGNSSQKKHGKTKVGDKDGDVISQLPDGIIHSILSFLPTKDVIRTSALSRRWEHLWTSISNIDFEYTRSCSMKEIQAHGRPTFFTFVDRLFMLHDDSDIKSFRLHSHTNVNAYRINSWVSAAVKHNCNELDLSLPEGRYALPSCLFNCLSLTVQKIHIEGSFLKVPTSVHLPSLKRLHLSTVTLGINSSSLFSSCPVLQELKLSDCEWHGIKCLTIANPSLKGLIINSVELDAFEAGLKVYAASLSSFEFQSSCRINASLLDAPALVNAYVVQLWLPEWGEGDRCTFKLLGQMHNVKSLKVHDNTLQTISGAENFLVHLPVFHNLTCLKVITDGVFCETIKSLVEFLQKIPNLESLSIEKHCSNTNAIMLDGYNLEVVPCCLRSKLKTFKMSCFQGTEPERHLLEFVLKNAGVLELVKIRFGLDERSKDLEKLESARKKEIQLLPRCSEKCAMIFTTMLLYSFAT